MDESKKARMQEFADKVTALCNEYGFNIKADAFLTDEGKIATRLGIIAKPAPEPKAPEPQPQPEPAPAPTPEPAPEAPAETPAAPESQ